MGTDPTGPGTAYLDIIEGVRWQEEAGQVSSIQRMFIVSGLPTPITSADGTTSGSKDSNIPLALAHADVPRPGDPHPMQPTVFVTSRSGKAISPTQVNILVTYARPEGGSFDPPDNNFVVSGGSSIEQVETSKFVLARSGGWYVLGGQTVDENIVVKPPQSIITEGNEEVNKDQVASVAAFEARSTVSISNTFQQQSPWDFGPQVTNMVNTGSWRYDGGYGNARSWLISEYTYELADPTTSPPMYRQSVTFRYNPNTWDPEVFWVDPRTGRPPKDVGGTDGGFDGKSYYRVATHDDLDFNGWLSL